MAKRKKCIVDQWIKNRAKKIRGYCPAWFAKDSGISPQLLQKHRDNPDMPWSPKIAKRIEEATGEEILASRLIY